MRVRLPRKIFSLFTMLSLVLPSVANGEGTQQLGLNQDIDVKTEFKVDILKVGEVINIAVGTNVGDGSGTITVTVKDAAGKAVTGSPFSITKNQPGYLPKPGVLPPSTIINPLQIVTKSTGTYSIKFTNSKSLYLDPLDITVTGSKGATVSPSSPPGGLGRLHAKSWSILGDSYTLGTSPEFYVLVPVGKTKDVTWLMEFNGLAGFEYTVMGNASGLPSAYSSPSAQKISGATPAAEFEVYLHVPAVAKGGVTSPKLGHFAMKGASSCKAAMLGMSNNFSFNVNMDTGYTITIDTDSSGTFDPSKDLVLSGKATAGTTKVTWDGKDGAGKLLKPGSYKARLEAKVGEFHFVADDVETVNPGLRIFKVDPPKVSTVPAAALMYWDDTVINNKTYKIVPVTTLPKGLSSGKYSATPVCSTTGKTGVNAHCWGNFTTDTSKSPGDERYIDTWVNAHLLSNTITMLVLDPKADDDNDGLTNLEECPLKTDPKKADTDGDGIKDGDEVGGNIKTNPLVKDTDGDGLDDGVEDRNKDGNLDSGELNPTLKDTDSDGLEDGHEDRDKDGLKGSKETDGLKADTDGDGLKDGLEDKDKDGKVGATETDPLNPDTDGDTLTDGWVDKDGDKIWDVLEGEDRDNSGTTETTETDPLKKDTDGGCEDDGSEERNSRDPLKPSDDVCPKDGGVDAMDGGVDATDMGGASDGGVDATDSGGASADVGRRGYLYGTGGCSVGSGPSKQDLGIFAVGLLLMALVRRRRRGLIAGLLLLLLLLARPANAQNDALIFPVNNFKPVTTMPGNFIVTEAAAVLPHLSPSANFLIHYTHRPLAVYTPGGELETEVIRYRLGMDMSMSIGFLDRVEIGLTVPVLMAQDSEDLTAISRSSDASLSAARGDLRLTPKVYIATVGPVSFGAAVPVTIPTGDEENLYGEAGGTITPKAIVSLAVGKFAAGLNAGVMVRNDQSISYSANQDQVTISHQFQLSAGLRYRAWREVIDLLADIYMGLALEEQDTEEIPAELLVAARFHLPKGFLATVGAGPGLTHGLGTPTFRFFAGVGYQYLPPKEEKAEGPADRDGDGIADAADRCPDQPEDMDGFEDDDGCPDLDNDGDGIPDAADKCPGKPEDRDGFQDDDGCPELDNDGDGILDASDKCPLKPEDRDGFEDSDGCPDPDNDGDGIPDADDKCPLKPEAFNGVDDEDGCPDKGTGKVQLDVERRRITVPPVYFATDKDVILKRSFPTLLLVADVLSKNTWVKLVSIEGHTDDRGSDDYNQKLSARRAASVVTFLIENGVSRERLASQGHGEAKPVDSNNTSQGRAKNRRVEFLIIKPKP